MSHNRVCDRCGKVANGYSLPGGWIAIQTDRCMDGVDTKDLCDECAQKFASFIGGKDE